MAFWENYTKLCAARGKSPSAVANEIGYSSATVTGWKQGASPRGIAIQRLMDYFDVSMEELVSDKDAEVPDTVDNDDLFDFMISLREDQERRMLFKTLRGATTEEIRTAVKIIEVLKQSRSGE